MKNKIILSQPRQRIRVNINNAFTLEGDIGSTIEEFLSTAQTEGLLDDQQLIAAICDYKLRELSYPLIRDCNLSPIFLGSTDGGRIYRRSLVLLMTTAVDELFNGAKVSVNYATTDGGYFCEALDREAFDPSEVARIEERMREIVAMDEPINKTHVPLADARAIFVERGDKDKAQLLEYRQDDDLTIYTLRGRPDYYFGYMVPSTGYLKTFRLIHKRNGFILQYPRGESPDVLKPIRSFNKLGVIFHQADLWMARLGISNIGQLNRLVVEHDISELIMVTEALHEQRVAAIATEIYRQWAEQGVRIVLIAGPTSAGKTTFSKRLAVQLLAQGLRPFTLEMDNYFVDRELTPLDEEGNYDFEALEAVNLKLFNQDLKMLLAGEKVQLPHFDFLTGTSSPGRFAQLHDRQIIIIEGIHGMNPDLVPEIPPEAIFRVYVSVMAQLNIDSHNRVPTTDVRMLRRIVRDARSRGYKAADTIEVWGRVRRGEKRNVFPYQENADIMFNSALSYELAALKPLAEPLLLQVKAETPEHIEAKRLLSFLQWVLPMSTEQLRQIPDISLLREFIGGSILEDYHPGKPQE